MQQEVRPVFGGLMHGTQCWKKFPLFKDDPSPIYFDYNEYEQPTIPKQEFKVIEPIKLSFNPMDSIRNDDAKEHEGISFAMLWADKVARTLWLVHKPFYITSQYFRKGCMDSASWLRSNPEHLLKERVTFNLEWIHFNPGDNSAQQIGAQAVPYLIWALNKEGKWPYLMIPDAKEIRYTVSKL